MVLFGTIVNSACIIIGSLLGLFFTNIPERYKETVMHGIGLAGILIGLQIAFSTEDTIVVLLSVRTGVISGYFCHLAAGLMRLGTWIASQMATSNTDISIAQGFVTASLISGIGAMSVIGAIDSGIRGEHEILITRGTLDGFM